MHTSIAGESQIESHIISKVKSELTLAFVGWGPPWNSTVPKAFVGSSLVWVLTCHRSVGVEGTGPNLLSRSRASSCTVDECSTKVRPQQHLELEI